MELEYLSNLNILGVGTHGRGMFEIQPVTTTVTLDGCNNLVITDVAQNGKKDALFDLDGVRASFEKLRDCYRKAGVPEKFRARLYDTPHEFNAEMQAEAWEWLKKWM